MSTIEEPTPARPWRPEDGPPPEVWTWPHGDRPALEVRSAGKWRYAPVMARQNWADGTVRYQVEVDLHGTTSVTARTYVWPHPGLRVAHGSGSEPSRGVQERKQGDMPQAPHRRAQPGT
ncbi:hypothetical protein [Streptomyces cahuitamycinicus]|uniref:Uncharacterized protein n=1 Tax=Streptomyces cahuitamycinicus TaxID=2070367 RepID=A0A2N8TTK3_9ACTN|nr:hypothetical protein [Streptomyces cahuitamycinicus]PNG22313.1 hypothetical protein C1J00_09875 [Streptomyces cahuitamycinicus]